MSSTARCLANHPRLPHPITAVIPMMAKAWAPIFTSPETAAPPVRMRL
jgi:hypothetical protein